MPRTIRNLFRRERQDSPIGKSPIRRRPSPTSQPPKKSYWDLAVPQLQQDEPSIFEALLEMLKDQDPDSGSLQAQLSSTVQKHKQTMEERQWTLPFKVRGREVKIRGQLDNLLKVLQATKDIGAAIAGMDPIHAGIPWTAVSAIFAGALSDSEQHTAALDGLPQVLPLIARYREIELIYLESIDTRLKKDFEICLIILYASVLKYQVSAGCHCQKNTFIRFLRAIPKLDAWASMLQEIKTNDSKCREFTAIFDSQDHKIAQCNLQSLMNSQEEKMVEWSRKLDDLVDDKKRQEHARILRWICDVIPGGDHQDILVTAKMGSEYKDSGSWLYRKPAFVAFMAKDGLRGPPFWLSGSVGMGKTSLVCRVVERCIENAGNNSGQVAYFYCSSKKGESQAQGTDPAVVLMSLVRQFAWTRDGDIAPPVTKIYRRLSGERPQSSDFSLGESSDLLVQLIKYLADTTIIIDALDECAHPYKLLRALKSLRNDTVGHLRILVSGRNQVDVSSVFEECTQTSIGSGSNTGDIRSFIQKEVKQGERKLLRRTEPALEGRLIETLDEKAQGNFRWVELQLAIFLDENTPLRLPESVLDKLDDLDKQVGIPDLTTVYDEIYRANIKASPRDRVNAEKCYQMLLGCPKPLKCPEIAKAVALNDDGTFNPSIDQRYLLDICSNLLILDYRGFLQFAHLSVIEYLRSESFDEIYSEENSHARIAETCLEYVNRQDGPPLDYNSRLHNVRFEAYAIVFWQIHCEKLTDYKRRNGKVGQLLSSLLCLPSVNPKFVRWLNEHDKILPILEGELKLRYLVSKQKTPLFTICACGFVECIDEAQSLFEREPKRLAAQNREGQTPLIVAAMNQKVSVVERLLRHDIDLETKCFYGKTALMLSVEVQQVEIFNLLLKSGADVHTRDASRASLLHTITKYKGDQLCQEHMVRVLLTNGCDIGTKNGYGASPLSMAIESNNIGMVQLFLNIDAQKAMVFFHGMTPLMHCVKRGTKAAIPLILKHTTLPALVSQNKNHRSVLTLGLKEGLWTLSRVADFRLNWRTMEARAKRTDVLQLLIDNLTLESVERLRSVESIEFAILLRLLKNTDVSRFVEFLHFENHQEKALAPVIWLRWIRGQSNTDEDLSCKPLIMKESSEAKLAEWQHFKMLNKATWSPFMPPSRLFPWQEAESLDFVGEANKLVINTRRSSYY